MFSISGPHLAAVAGLLAGQPQVPLIPQKDLLARRDFKLPDGPASERLRQMEQIFTIGLLCSVQQQDPSAIDATEYGIAPEDTCVFYEGAAMGLTILDLLTPWKKDRWQTLLEGNGAPHKFVMHVGMGMGIARLNQRIGNRLQKLDPLLRWLVIDGYGFHHGYCNSKQFVRKQARAGGRVRCSFSSRVFDQGLGRAIWFVEAGCPQNIAKAIKKFSSNRQPDLWIGIGVAASHAGADPTTLKELKSISGKYFEYLAQGTAFGAAVRHDTGVVPAHTSDACMELLNSTPELAHSLVLVQSHQLAISARDQHYDRWQRHIREGVTTSA